MEKVSNFLDLNEEQSLILRPARKVAVRAGAGSGKTRAIIARYLGILEGGEADIPQIVAVTFTENAAAELKSRISSEITKYIEDYGHRGNIAEGWRRKFFSAPIGTIHSFCSGILRENVFDSGLPLNFSVIEGSEENAFYEQNIGKFLLMKIEEGDPRLQRLLEMESYDYAQIMKIMAMILKEAARLHLVPPFSYYGENPSPKNPDSEALESMDENLHMRIKDYISVLSSQSKKRKQALQDLSGKIDMTLGLDRNIRYLRAVYEEAKKGMTKSEVEQSRLALVDTVFSVMGHYDSEINSIYLDLSGDAHRFLRERKILEEKIEYEDMIRLTIELLEKNPEILGYYRNFLKFVIVDEFQDTDSLQLRLMNLLTDGDSGGSLIVVGDVNQSVYGFRGAEPETFGKILQTGDFEKISFAANYRSSGSLIDFFNVFFAGSFPEGYYEKMTVPISRPGPGISVEIIACEGAKAGESIELEARAVASRIKEIRKESSEEIALLFRRSSNVSVYEKALAKEGIRFQSRIGRGFYDLPEVRDVMCMLTYFLDPQDLLARASVLRSPYFGASDDELFSHFRGEGRENGSRVGQYIRFLDEKRREYVSGDAFRAVDFAVTGLGYSSAVLALPDGKAKYLNLKKVLLMTENLVSHKGYGLRQVVEHFDSMRRTYEEEQVFEETNDSGVVKLLTVHGAKGLEFHTVFLCNTNYKKVPPSERVMADIKKGFVVRYPASSSNNWEDLKSRVEKKEAWEERRALYVAMTRAEERLFICFSGRRLAEEERMQLEKGSFAELIDSRLSLSSRCLEMPKGFTDDTWGISFPGFYEGGTSKGPDFPDTSSLGTEVPLQLKYMEPTYGREDKPERAEISPLPDLFSPTDRLKDPERVGSIMHRFLEVWDFREETAEKEIEFVLGEFLVSNPNMKELLLELSSNFLESELFSFIGEAREIRRELKFVFDPGEGASRRGRIDLLTEEDGGMRLFDYKYRKSMNEDAREAYEEQMDGYCEAIRSRFEKPLLSRHIVLIPQVELVSI